MLVEKKIKLRLRRPKAPAPILRTGVTRQGTVGIEYVHHGVKGWGASESAARAAWEANRSMAKNDPWAANLETPMTPDYRGRKANYRSGTSTVGKRMTGSVKGVASPKKVQPTRKAPRSTPGAGIITRDESQPPIHPSLVGKADQRASRGTRLRRQYLYDERFGISPMNRQNKEWRKEWKTNAAHLGGGLAIGAGAGAGVQHLRGGGRSRLVGAVAGGFAGELVGADVARRKLIRRLEHRGVLRGPHSYPKESASKGLVVKRDRRYNPEHNRQRRLGVATAATGIGGLALLAHGGRGVREATHIARRGIPFAPTSGRPAVILEEKGKKTRVIPVPQRVRERADDLHTRGVTASRRDLGEIGGGAGLVGTSAGIHRYSRSRSNREYR